MLPLRLSEDNEAVIDDSRSRARRLCNNGSNFDLKLFVVDGVRAGIRCRKRVVDADRCLCVLLEVCFNVVSPMKSVLGECGVVFLLSRSR